MSGNYRCPIGLLLDEPALRERIERLGGARAEAERIRPLHSIPTRPGLDRSPRGDEDRVAALLLRSDMDEVLPG